MWLRAQLSFVLSEITRSTDRLTKRRTECQNSHRYRPRLHYVQRGKNAANVTSQQQKHTERKIERIKVILQIIR